MTAPDALTAVLAPRSVAVIGASDQPHKIGGRPILFLKRFGYRGAIYPINPNRTEVQGLRAYPSLAALPESPGAVIIGLSGDRAPGAVDEAARAGAKLAIVYSSGFGESGDAGRDVQRAMVRRARAAGMRMLGPNCQGIANFGTGFVSHFSTMIHEVPPMDGPVAVVSQSGALSSLPYLALRQRGVGVRYVVTTGNEADLAVPELAAAVAQDDAVRLVLLYMEEILDPAMLASAAAIARSRDVPIVALKSARGGRGQRAAASHTGAMAAEDRVVDAFLRHHGIWRANDVEDLSRAAELYLKGWRPRGRRLVVVSNSGASCVLAADRAEAMAMPVPELAPATRAELADILPGFATTTNPVDITAALLSDSGLFSAILPVIGRDPDVDLCFAALPVLGTGYDLPRLARDSAAFADATGIPLAVASPQAEIAAVFRAAGVPTFDTEGDAMRGLDQLARHAALLRRVRRAPPNGASVPLPAGSGPFLSEAASLRLLADRGFPVVRWHLCGGEADAIAAFHAVGGPVVVKACSADVPHKSEHGLVTVGIADEAGVAAAFRSQWAKLGAMGVRREGILVAAMAHGRHEFMLGARRDPHFGPVVVVGDGGRYVEALRDFCLLVPPFETADVREALDELRIAPLYAGVRGEPPLDIDALCALAVRLGDLILDAGPSLASVDINPVIVGARGEGVVIVDALVERGGPA